MADVVEYIDCYIKNKMYGTLFMDMADILTDEEEFDEEQDVLFYVVVRLEGMGVSADEIRKLLNALFTFTKNKAVYDMEYVNKVYAFTHGMILL